uniref:Uncharacterized protein n=1 Tax=viral metagenome TaxID=1070528 RepID=A0A6C0JJF5_9ZZZZ
MDLKQLYFLSKDVNILEKYDLPYTFFTEPQKILSEETCLNEIIRILTTCDFQFPNDSSDLCEFVEYKKGEKLTSPYKKVELSEAKIVKTPFIKHKNNDDSFIKLLCFMKAYASHTYTHKGCFKEYFKDVFDVFYNINLNDLK